MTRIAVFPIDAAGHLNPMLAICRALARKPYVTAVRVFGRAELAALFRGVAVEYAVTMRNVSDGPAGDLAWKSFIRPLRYAAETLKAVWDFAPDVVLFDPFSVLGALAARSAGVGSAALVSMAGYGALGEDFVIRNGWNRKELIDANAEYTRCFGVDFRGEGSLPVLFPSANLSLVTTVETLALPVDPVTQPRLSKLVGAAGRIVHIGPCAGAEHLMQVAIQVLSHADGEDSEVDRFPFVRLDEAKRCGRRVVLFSLGTVITDFRYESPVGGAPTGRQFLQHALKSVIEVVRNDASLLLVAATGHRFDYTKIDRPADAIIRKTVPQQAILERYADVFITHHGANSQSESILAGVPMVSLPGVGDQLPNARVTRARGLAVSLWDLKNPFGTCNARLMGEAIRLVLERGACQQAIAEVGAQLRTAGGVEEAVRQIEALVEERWAGSLDF